MPPASTSRDRVLRTLLDINRTNRQSDSPGRLGRARLDSTTLEVGSSRMELAYATRVAFSWVYEILNELQSLGWMDERQPLRVRDPAAVIGWWRQRRTLPRVNGFQAKDPQIMARQLKEQGIRNAVTTYYGENRYHGHLFPRRMDTYVRLEDLPKARRAVVDLGGQLGGTNFRIWTGDDGVVDDRQSGPPGPMDVDFAMVPQIILDLYHEGGSAAEAADLMTEKEFLNAHARLR